LGPTDFFVIDTAFYVVPKPICSSLPFIYHVLRAHHLGSLGADSAVPGLNRNLAYMSKQVVPPNPLLAKFDSIVGQIVTRAHRCNQESRALRDLRDTLLPRLISGELEVNDDD
jgi:type I restriction enzyme, S subunit